MLDSAPAYPDPVQSEKVAPDTFGDMRRFLRLT